ncbi:MAG: hypothetical protein JWM04_1037, partial [Verrucomicrobiales bacterium]|nr:hypothetical protein [Verrucomicrobiales bacterium]
IGSAPLLDSTNRIWFMAGPRPRYAGMPMNTSLNGDTSTLRGRALMSNAFIAKFESKALVRDLPDDPFGLVANLCYFSATGLVRVATNLVAGTQLLKGRDGQVIGVASSGNRFDGLIPPASTYGFHTFFLENQTLQFARTLHELALTHFDLVSHLAPSAIPTASTIHGRFSSQSAICNFQGILWISQYNEVEAYRDGKPMGVSKKLTLLNHVEGLKTLLGPLQTPSGPTMIVAIQKSTGPLFFIATPNGDEMSLKPFGPPEESSDLSSHVLVDSSFFASQTTEDALSQSRRLQNPLWSEPSQTLYFASAFGKAWSANLLGSWKQLLEGNNPALIRNNGDLVIERQYEAAKGFRIVSTGSTKDIRPTWFKSLSVLAELPGGKLICASPQGLVWLRENADSNFQVELEIPLSIGGQVNSYVGQIGSKIFFTVLDSQNSLYLGYVTTP